MKEERRSEEHLNETYNIYIYLDILKCISMYFTDEAYRPEPRAPEPVEVKGSGYRLRSMPLIACGDRQMPPSEETWTSQEKPIKN